MMENFYNKHQIQLINITQRKRQIELISVERSGTKQKETTLPSTEIIRRRFVYLDDRHKGEELTIREIENIGMFLKHGAMYRMYDSNTL